MMDVDRDDAGGGTGSARRRRERRLRSFLRPTSGWRSRWPCPSSSTTPHEDRGRTGLGERYELDHTAESRKHLSPRAVPGHRVWVCRGGHIWGWSGTSWSTWRTSALSCRFLMPPVPHPVENVTDTLRILDLPIAEQVIAVPTISCSPLFLSRSQRNSWWKCRQSCLPRASLFRSRSRSSTLQFLVVVAKGVFKVFFQDRVQKRHLLLWNAFLSGLWSSSWTLLLVWGLDRDLPHLLVLQMRILLGFYALFPKVKKVRRAGLRTRVRGCPPVAAHPRRLLSWRSRPVPDSVEWVEIRERHAGKTYYWSRRTHSTVWQAPAGVEVVWYGERDEEGGIWYACLQRLSSLLFFLGEELYRQPRAVYKYWVGGYVSVTMQRPVPAVLRVRFVSVHRHVLNIPVMLQRQVSAVLLCRSRCALFLKVMDVPVITQLMFLLYFEDVEMPQFPSSTECYRFQLYCSVVYVQCTLCKHRGFHSAVLGLVVHAPVVMLRQLLVVGQCRKLWKFRSCRWCSSWWLLTRPLSL